VRARRVGDSARSLQRGLVQRVRAGAGARVCSGAGGGRRREGAARPRCGWVGHLSDALARGHTHNRRHAHRVVLIAVAPARAHSAEHAPDQRPRCERVREVRARSVSGIGPAQAPLRYVRGRRGRGAERAGSAAHRLGRRAAARVRRAGPRHRPAAHGRARAAGAAALQVRCPTTPTSSCRRRIRSHADVFVQKTNAKIYQVEAVRYDLANLPDEYG